MRVLHLITKLMSDIFKERVEVVFKCETSRHLVSVKSPECALYRTAWLWHVTWMVSEKFT